MRGIVAHGGTRLAYEVTGPADGPALVLGHSFLCDGSMWRHQVPVLAQRHRVVNLDARGHGASGPVTAPCTLDDLVEDAVVVADHLGVERAVWIGLSMGGMVAMRAALRHPERVSALALLDTDGGRETAWRRLKYGALARVAQVAGLRPVRGQIERQMFGPTTRRKRPELVRDWSDTMLATVDVPSMLQLVETLRHRDDVMDALGRLDIPALVVVGEEDEGTPPDRARRLAGAIPGARLVQIAGAGHLTTLERPDEVSALLTEFLDHANDRH